MIADKRQIDSEISYAHNLPHALVHVATLPCVATTDTDCHGQYEFVEAPSAGRYYVMGVTMVAGAETLVIVGLTDTLQASDRDTLDRSASFPWTWAVTP
jgi:hypothetical protein